MYRLKVIDLSSGIDLGAVISCRIEPHVDVQNLSKDSLTKDSVIGSLTKSVTDEHASKSVPEIAPMATKAFMNLDTQQLVVDFERVILSNIAAHSKTLESISSVISCLRTLSVALHQKRVHKVNQ